MKFDNISDLSDKELVDLFQSTESEETRESVFVEIYGRYRRKVEAWVEAKCRLGMLSESYIDDVVNAVFFDRLYPEGERKGLLGFRQECSLEVYIRTVTRNCILDESRKGHPKSLDEMVETQGELVELQRRVEAYRTWSPISPTTPQQIVIRKQMREILKAAIDLLGQGPRKDSWKDAYIIRMYYWKKMTDRETGEFLGMKEGTVTVRRHRAHKKLRAILKQKFGIKNLDDIL
ncbi:TPA: sigma-70 family RNA polymerase sigma factor [Candidatus Bathyarchaeota archaeon]|nr:sigma-70 family RNA polymerase sigma factor [Candidatus Bathyarchaeota archaeon]